MPLWHPRALCLCSDPLRTRSCAVTPIRIPPLFVFWFPQYPLLISLIPLRIPPFQCPPDPSDCHLVPSGIDLPPCPLMTHPPSLHPGHSAPLLSSDPPITSPFAFLCVICPTVALLCTPEPSVCCEGSPSALQTLQDPSIALLVSPRAPQFIE